ncbi:TPR repeat-containing protein YrrB [Planctomycetes bacterium Pan216]|uniref:TPR repeat-containing protein YrrB n=1 Tax=Kolteria novifilia TaxID=2527975 RepID=A0A518BAW4_9BACT|nr:TPR repeat-containing protein YrrB [Planctomycetes bacterium Pan216]
MSSQALQKALALHQAGNLAGAEKAYREILRRSPDHGELLFLLGTLRFQREAFPDAISLLKRAVGKLPRHARAQANLGLALHASGSLEDAITAFRASLRLDPKQAEIHFNLGNALAQRGQAVEAIDSFRQAIRLAPRMAAFHNNLGLALRQRKDIEGARKAFKDAVRSQPDFVEAQNNLGALERELGHLPQAVECFRQVARLRPDFLPARDNLIMSLAQLGRLDEAQQACRELIDQFPSRGASHQHLAKILQTLGCLHEAEASYLRALEVDPNLHQARADLGLLLTATERHQDAVAHLTQAAAKLPNDVTVQANLGRVLSRVDEFAEARRCFVHIARSRPEGPLWELAGACLCPTLYESSDEITAYRQQLVDALTKAEQANPATVNLKTFLEIKPHPSFNLPFHGRDEKPLKSQFGRVFSRYVDAERPKPGEGKPHVGFVVTDRHETPFLRDWSEHLAQFDHRSSRTTIICSPAGRTKIEPVLGREEIGYLEMPVFPEVLCEAMGALRCDLLYFPEVATDVWNYVLPYRRLAPLQATGWGIQVTSGIPAIDLYLSSRLVEPDDGESHYTERLVTFEGLPAPRKRLRVPEQPLPREAFGLSSTDHVYLCPQQLGKFHPDIDDWIGELLRRDPKGVVVITEGTNKVLARKLMDRFARKLSDVAPRIRFVPQQRGEGYPSLLLAADVVIDPPHFSGMNVSYDAFGLGKIVVTLPTCYQRGRYTLGCYRAMEIDEPIADDVEGYLQRAMGLASDRDRREELERRIARASVTLFEEHAMAVRPDELFLSWIEESRSLAR